MWVWLQIGESPKKKQKNIFTAILNTYLITIISTSVSMMASLPGSSEHISQVGSKIAEKQIKKHQPQIYQLDETIDANRDDRLNIWNIVKPPCRLVDMIHALYWYSQIVVLVYLLYLSRQNPIDPQLCIPLSHLVYLLYLLVKSQKPSSNQESRLQGLRCSGPLTKFIDRHFGASLGHWPGMLEMLVIVAIDILQGVTLLCPPVVECYRHVIDISSTSIA